MNVREFLLPDLGEGLEDAEIVAWRVAEGDRVALNETLVEVNTAKALVEMPAPWEGAIERLHGSAGDIVKVGAALVSIRVDVEADTEATAEREEPVGEETPTTEEETRPKRRAVLVGYGVEEDEPARPSTPRDRATRAPGDGSGGPVPASPPVRRLAKELGIDLADVEGSGPGGRVTREDVLRASEGEVISSKEGLAGVVQAGPPMGEVEVVPLRGTRRLTAEKMSRSAREIPHVTTFLTVDASSLQAFRAALSSGAAGRLSPLPIVVRTLVEICRDHPSL